MQKKKKRNTFFAARQTPEIKIEVGFAGNG
jgi:hypothetical protein